MNPILQRIYGQSEEALEKQASFELLKEAAAAQGVDLSGVDPNELSTEDIGQLLQEAQGAREDFDRSSAVEMIKVAASLEGVDPDSIDFGSLSDQEIAEAYAEVAPQAEQLAKVAEYQMGGRILAESFLAALEENGQEKMGSVKDTAQALMARIRAMTPKGKAQKALLEAQRSSIGGRIRSAVGSATDKFRGLPAWQKALIASGAVAVPAAGYAVSKRSSDGAFDQLVEARVQQRLAELVESLERGE